MISQIFLQKFFYPRKYEMTREHNSEAIHDRFEHVADKVSAEQFLLLLFERQIKRKINSRRKIKNRNIIVVAHSQCWNFKKSGGENWYR